MTVRAVGEKSRSHSASLLAVEDPALRSQGALQPPPKGFKVDKHSFAGSRREPS